MTLWTELDRAMMAAGDDIILRQRGEIYEIRFNGIELMSNLTWRSEAVLAERSIRVEGRATDEGDGERTRLVVGQQVADGRLAGAQAGEEVGEVAAIRTDQPKASDRNPALVHAL